MGYEPHMPMGATAVAQRLSVRFTLRVLLNGIGDAVGDISKTVQTDKYWHQHRLALATSEPEF